MMSNHLYNLMNQLVQESKSLKRIKENYTEDAGECSQCQEFWNEIAEKKEEVIKKLTILIKDHLQNH